MQSSRPTILPIDPRRPQKEAVARAAEALRRGELIILPTDTVYGIAADPRVAGAAERLYDAKGRDRDKPIPLLVDDIRRIAQHGAVLGLCGQRLARRFWPGPLTLVLPAGGKSEGFRIPNHRVTLAVLHKIGAALRVTSANRSGDAPARTAAEAAAALGDFVTLALDAGPAPRGEASSVVRVHDRGFDLLREGAIPLADLRRAAAQKLLLFVCSGNVCRSPMAEYLMRRWLGPDSEWTVRSAGASALDGLPASGEAVDVLREMDVDLTPHRSRSITRELVDAASLIVVMTDTHRSTVLERFPEAQGKVFLLKSFGAATRERDVADPIGLPIATYRQVRDEINAVLPDLVLSMHGRGGENAPTQEKGLR